MANLFFVSHTHFGHANIIKYCDRPFAHADEMDEAMVERWNAAVRPQDHVYHLGDVAMKQQKIDAVLPRLNGHLRLVRGNHDIFKTQHYLRYFDEIYASRVLDNIVFTHIPIHPMSLGRFVANAHGHVHNNQDFAFPYVNLSVEVRNYTPLAFEDLKKEIAMKKAALPAKDKREEERRTTRVTA